MEEQIETLKRDYRRLELDGADRAMLDYTALLTVAPWRMDESRVQALRVAGWSDREILEINQVASVQNLMSRTTTGLGVVDTVGDFERAHEEDAAALRVQILAGDAP